MSVESAVRAVRAEIKKQTASVAAFRATVTDVDGSLIKIRREGASTANTELYASGWHAPLAVGDVALCVPIGGKPVIVDVISGAGSIQAMIDAATARGGGIVQLGPGTFDVSGLLIDSNVWLRGSGVDATVLRSTANYPVILTRTFGTNSGTNNTDSEVNFKISDLTINGMKGTYAGSNGYGIRVHGANFSLERIRVYDCNEVGIDSEWSSSASAPTTTGMQHSMEARLVDVEVHECDSHGIYWNGPHDSMWTNCIAWENGAAGFYVTTKGDALVATGCHSWGNNQTQAWRIGGSGCHLIGCTGEGASTEQVLIEANDCVITGGVYFAAGGGLIGIHVNTCAGYMIRTKVLNCTTAAIKYTSDSGLGWVEILSYQTSGTAESGTPDASSVAKIKVFGGGTGDDERNWSVAGAGGTVVVQEGDATVDAAAGTLDFDASDFNVTSSPAGEANIALAYGTSAGTPAEGNHTHAAALVVSEAGTPVDSAVGTINFDGTDFNVSSSPAGTANVSLAYGTSANVPAEGNHAHTALTVSEGGTPVDSAVLIVNMDATDFNVTSSPAGTANISLAYGTSANTPAEGNHAHALADLSDVTAAAPGSAAGKVLAWDGASAWDDSWVYCESLGPWYEDDVAGTATTSLKLLYMNTGTAVSQSTNRIRAGRTGWIVGAKVTSDAARTAGTCTVQVDLSGVGTSFDAGSVVLDATRTTQDATIVTAASGINITSGSDTIGVQIVTSGWTPTTANLFVTLLVIWNPIA